MRACMCSSVNNILYRLWATTCGLMLILFLLALAAATVTVAVAVVVVSEINTNIFHI